MKTLREVLANEREHHTITNLARDLGFKSDNIKLFFDKFKKEGALNLVVDVNYTAGGDTNNANLLEGKLTQFFNIDVVVIVQGKITDPANKQGVANCSFPLEDSVSKITEFLGRNLETITFNDPQFSSRDLARTLRVADQTIAKLKKLAAGSASSMTFKPRLPSPTEAANIAEFLSPDNRQVAEATMHDLPPSVLVTVFAAFNEKKRQQTDGKTSDSKHQKPDQSPVRSPGAPGISVK